MTDLDINQKIQLVVALGNWKEGEDTKFWTRYNLFLTLNSGLLAASFIGDSSVMDLRLNGTTVPVGGIIVGMFGLLLSYVWKKLLDTSKSYISRWIKDLDHLLSSEPALEQYVKGYSDASSRLDHTTQKKATEYGRLVVAAYSVMWSIIAFINLLELASWSKAWL